MRDPGDPAKADPLIREFSRFLFAGLAVDAVRIDLAVMDAPGFFGKTPESRARNLARARISGLAPISLTSMISTRSKAWALICAAFGAIGTATLLSDLTFLSA